MGTYPNALRKITLAGLLAVSCITSAAQASVILKDWTGATNSGFGNLAMNKNDDGSSQEIFFDTITGTGFQDGLNFFGSTYDSFFINNNGNITFNAPVSAFTPNAFPISSQPMIAPFWGDVDTRCGDCGNVYIGSPNAETLVVTWDSVGYYPSESDKTNTFQLVMIDRSDTGSGNFDVEFRYEDINWTTGGASEGEGGLGGIPAQAGYDAGNGVNYFTLPGSRTSSVVDLDTMSSNTDTAGIWKFAIRNGELPGSDADNPLMPVIDPQTPTEYVFEFVIEEDQQIFIDPEVAIGYDYIVNSGPDITSVLLPEDIGDGMYDLWLWDETLAAWYDTSIDITGGVEYLFEQAVSRFRIMGIELQAMLDPTNPTAFITGLTFSEAGLVNMNQNAVTQFVDDGTDVPEPRFLMSFALMMLVASAWRRKVRR